MTSLRFTCTSLATLIILLQLITGCNSVEQRNSNLFTTDSLNLDGLDTVPEWLTVLADEVLESDSLNIWVPGNDFQISSLLKFPRFPRKYYPVSSSDSSYRRFEIVPLYNNQQLHLSGVRNEQVSAQLVVAAKTDLTHLRADVSKLLSTTGDSFSGDNVQVRFIRYVPVQRSASEYIWSARYEDVAGDEVSGNKSPDVVADPLLVAESVNVPAYRTQAIWFTFRIPHDVAPGSYKAVITVTAEEFKPRTFELSINVLSPVLPEPSQYSFYLDLWSNPFAIAANHHVECWSEKHWELIKKYNADLQSRGVKTITTTILHDPWQIPWKGESMRAHTATGYESMVKWILKEDGHFDFDYHIFDRFVETAMVPGTDQHINAFSMTVFRGRERITYYNQKKNKFETEELEITDPQYEKRWGEFLNDFSNHLREKGWLDKTYLCFDERPPEVLTIINKIILQSAPGFSGRLSFAGKTDHSDVAEHLSLSYELFPGEILEDAHVPDVIANRNRTGKLTTFYLCGQPDHPNTFTYSPAIEAQLIPWLALNYHTAGYLRWSYCNWPSDPYGDPVFYYNQGDDYIVYPGNDGPVSSIRWELLKEGIEDYELMRIALKKKPNDVLLQQAVKLAIRNADGRRKDLRDMETARQLVLEVLEEKD